MTHPDNPAPDAPKKWPRYLLIASLGVNLLIIGMVGGAVLRGGPPDKARSHFRNFGSVGLRSYVKSLDAGGRAELRRAIADNKDRIHAGRKVQQDHLIALAAALRATPYAPALVEQVLATQRQLVEANIGIGHDILSKRINAMTTQQRLQFADRLENQSSRKRKLRGPDPRPQN